MTQPNAHNVIDNNLNMLSNYIRTYYPSIKGSDFITLTDIIYMAAIRNNIHIPILLQDLYNGILDLDKYRDSTSGNIYEFIRNDYVEFSKRIKDITIGSNGGMANVGKGEWLISICSGIDPEKKIPRVNIIKNGKGDLLYVNSNETEEVKWNGGKVSVEKPGNVINRKFNALITIEDKKWVPFRAKDKTKYAMNEIHTFNAKYWQAISDEVNDQLSDDELKQKIISMSFSKVFDKCNKFVMFNDDGTFQRFNNVDESKQYYDERLALIKGSKGFECRASQSNPVALYCHVF